MRRLLFAFLIVLMPLRGWAGDAMAVHMLTQNQSATLANATLLIANDERSTWASGLNGSQLVTTMSGDCPGHHEAASAQIGSSDQVPGQTSSTHGECKTCSACQICHTVAVEPDAPTTAMLQSAQHAQPGAVSTPFASAILTPGLKPPIS